MRIVNSLDINQHLVDLYGIVINIKELGCFGWIGIIFYSLNGIGFLFYLFSESNEVIGYLDISFLIIGIIIPIIVVSKIYKKENLNRLFKLSYQILAILSFCYFTAIIQGVSNDGVSGFDDFFYHLSISISLLILSSILIYLLDIKPKIKQKKEIKRKNTEYISLMKNGRLEVENNNKIFKQKLIELYDDKFDLSEVIVEEFAGLDSKNNVQIIQKDSIILTCKEHDYQFRENILDAFKSKGCKRCKIENHFKLAKRKREKEYFKEFKKRLSKTFNEKYDFSKVEFKNLNQKISVTCPNHGIFSILPTALLKGQGCPVCASVSHKNSKNTYKEDLPVNEEVEVTLKEYQILHSLLEEVIDSVNQIKKVGEETKEKIEKIDTTINVLVKIEELKTSKGSQDEEESISGILNLIESQVEFKGIGVYKNKVKKWFKFWEKLEPQSQEFMSQSEFLYNSIESSKFADYSPFILYYCRVLEFELLNKVFLSFHQYVKESFPEIESLFKYNPEEVNKDTLKDIESGQMASFKRKFKDPKYTLGDMRLILDLLPNKKKPEGSKRFQALPALQELYKYINQSIGSIKSDIIKDIGVIINQYRNPSAHVGVIDKIKADQFYKLYKTTMNSLFNSFH